MPYAIELFFNPPLETRLRKLCNVFRAEIDGAVTVIEDVKARPHVSLAVMNEANVIELSETLRELAGRHAAMPLAFSSVGLFPAAEPVLFLAPVVTQEFLAFHAELWSVLPRFAKGAWNEYSPARLVPHCTLLTSVRKDQLKQVSELVMENTFPISGELVELGLVQFAPVKPVMSAMLA